MVEGMRSRLPRWYQDDLLVQAFHDEIENIKLEKYYKAMCQHVIQPIQVWRESSVGLDYANYLREEQALSHGGVTLVGLQQIFDEDEIVGKVAPNNLLKSSVQLNVASGTEYLGDTQGFDQDFSSMLQSVEEDGEYYLKYSNPGIVDALQIMVPTDLPNLLPVQSGDERSISIEVKGEEQQYNIAPANVATATSSNLNTEGFGAIGGTISSSTVQRLSDFIRSLQVNIPGNESPQGVYISPMSVDNSSGTYTIGAWVYAPNGFPGQIRIHEMVDEAIISQNIVPFTGTGTWQFVTASITFTTGTGISGAIGSSQPTESSTFYIGAVSVVEGDKVYGYPDPSTGELKQFNQISIVGRDSVGAITESTGITVNVDSTLQNYTLSYTFKNSSTRYMNIKIGQYYIPRAQEIYVRKVMVNEGLTPLEWDMLPEETIIYTDSNPIPDPNETYYASIEAKANTQKMGLIFINWYDSEENLIINTSQEIELTTEYQRFEVSESPPIGATSYQIGIYTDELLKEGDTFYSRKLMFTTLEGVEWISNSSYKIVESNNYARIIATKEYPIKEIRFYDENGTLYNKTKFTKLQKRTRATITVNEILEKFYVEVEYWGIGASKKVGFPQEADVLESNIGNLKVKVKDEETIQDLNVYFRYSSEEYLLQIGEESFTNGNIYTLIQEINENSNYITCEFYSEGIVEEDVTYSTVLKVVDPVYTTNDYLEKVAINHGLERRKYRSDMTNHDLPLTYPVGYLYEDEQDYYLEKRLLNEYVVSEVNETADLNLIEVMIRPEVNEAKHLDLILYKDDINNSIILRVKDINIDQIDRETIFSGETIPKLVTNINTNSELVTATFIQDNELDTSYRDTITQTGLFDRYGTLRTGIYQRLGVIPEIQDMSDRLLKLSMNRWNSKWWGDDGIYSAGVFFVDIPLHNIPSNFELASIEELQLICDKSKTFGTYPIPEYVVKTSTEFKFEEPFYHIPEDMLEVELEPMVFDSYRSLTSVTIEGVVEEEYPEVFPPIGFLSQVTDIYEEVFKTSQMNFGYPKVEGSSVNLTLIHDTDADFSQDTLQNLIVNSNSVLIDTAEKSLEKTPTQVAVSGTGLSWTNAFYTVDGSNTTYANSNSGSGSISRNPTSQSQSGTGELAWINPANACDTSTSTYAYSESRTVSNLNTGAKRSTTQTSVHDGNPSGGGHWLSMDRVEVNDGNGAYASATTVYRNTNLLRLTGFGFNIPANATIKGVVVHVERKTSTTVSGTRDYKVRLIYNSTQRGDNKASADSLEEYYITKTYGSSTDGWNASLTPGIVNSSTFGVDISYYNGTAYNPSFYVDYMDMTVYYTITSDETQTNYLDLSGNLNYSIPSGSTIAGVKIDVMCKCDSASKQLEVSVIAGGVTKVKTVNMPTTTGTISFGSSSDMWGGLPNNFTSLALKLRSKTYDRAYIYYVTATVYYSTTLSWTQYITVSNFGHSIPSNSKVTGVKATIKCYSPSSSKTIESSITIGGITKTKTMTLPTTEGGTITLGSNTDLWGGLPTSPSSYSSIALQMRTNIAGSKIYYITVKVYYKYLSGTLTSIQIDAPPTGNKWNSISINHTKPANTTIYYDILKASDSTVLLSNQIGPEINLIGIPYVNIKLRAKLASTVIGTTPSLNRFQVSHQENNFTIIDGNLVV